MSDTAELNKEHGFVLYCQIQTLFMHRRQKYLILFFKKTTHFIHEQEGMGMLLWAGGNRWFCTCGEFVLGCEEGMGVWKGGHRRRVRRGERVR